MTLQSSIQIFDGISPALRSMHNAMSVVISSFETMQNLSSNAIDNSAIQAAQNELANVEAAFQGIEEQVRRADDAQQRLNNDIRNGGLEADNFASKIKHFVGAYAGLAGIRKAKSWLEESMDLSNTQMNAERQLRTVLGNTMSAVNADMGAITPTVNMSPAEDAFESIKATAANIQGYTLYGDEALIGGAAELATYISDANAIQNMMGTLANYAAGMSSGGEVSTQQMVDYATQLGKALDGTYDGLKKKGFELSEAQKQIIDNGTDMEKALILDDIISQSWAGLAAQMANTPQGLGIQLANEFGDIREEVGARLYPNIMQFFEVVKTNMPVISSAVTGFGDAAGKIIVVLSGIVSAALSVYSVFADNWSWIGPIVMGLVTVFGLYNSALLVHKGIAMATTAIKSTMTLMETAHAAAIARTSGLTFAATINQYGFNAALLACPLTWIVGIVILFIAIIYAAIAAVNHFAGTSYSATGYICGAFLVLAAVVGNTVIGLFNGLIQLVWTIFAEPFLGIIEWILNVTNGGFDSFGDAVANLIGQIISWFLSLGKVVTTIIDAIFGTNWTAGLSSLQESVTSWGKNDSAITLERNAPLIDYRFNYGDAYNTGYDFGAGLEDKIGGFFDSGSLEAFEFNDALSGMAGDLDGISGDTGAIRDSVEVTSEELKYLRDLAEQEVINRFTTAEIKVDMVNHNTISNTGDYDDMMGRMREDMEENMLMVAEGVHS